MLFGIPHVSCWSIVLLCIVFFIYPLDLQESDEGAIHKEAITSTCFQRYRDIAVRFFFIFCNRDTDNLSLIPRSNVIYFVSTIK